MGLRFEGIVDYCRDEAGSFGLEIVAAVRVQDDQVRPCRACTSDGVPAPHLSEILLRKTVRFSRPDPHATIEATVSRVERRECASLSILYLQTPSAPPPFLCMGDTLILETLDGVRYWECDVRICADDRFFDDYNEQSLLDNTVVVHVRHEQVIMGPKLLPPQLMGILVQPAPKPLCHLTNNGRGATFQRAHKRAALNEAQCRAKPKIKIGINGYGGIGRIMARVILQSQDVELVAINDSSITDHMTCMFRDCNTDGPWRQSDFKVKDSNTLLFGDKEVTIFTINECDIVPWYKTGAQYIVETIDSNQSADDYRVHVSEYPRYIDIDPNSIAISNPLAPLSNILQDRFGTCVCSPATQNSCRAPVLQIIPGNFPSAAKAVSEVLPYWNGMETAMRFHVPAVDEPVLDVTVELEGFGNYRLMSRNTKPNVDLSKLVAWCVDMIRQIPQVWLCRLKVSPEQR